MDRRLISRFGTLIGAAALFVSAGHALAQRVALVIGNSTYREAPLANPVNDAGDMAKALREAGFKVFLERNAGTRDMRQAIRDFGTELRRAEVGLFYFAGHGVQVKGNSYLVPVGADICPRPAPGSIASVAPGTSLKDCEVCPEMVVIPAGSFMMGSPGSEAQRDSHEGPQHRVAIERPFAAGKYEVTFDEWDACVRENGCSYNPHDSGWGRGRRPVIYVSWNDAKAYAEWLSRKTGGNYRLLTEAEWEYVARAGTTTVFSFGNAIAPQQANYYNKVADAGSPVAASRGQTVPVGSYPANAFGLHDVHGNAWEWTEDCWNGS